VVALLSTGCGLLVERLVGFRLPGALIPAVGFALIIVCGQFLTLADATAELTTPVAAALAVAGIGLSWRQAAARIDGWAVTLALAAFAAFAAPIVLSGDATFAGYTKLDDTSTWMALTDRVMEAGRSLGGLAPSTYEAALKFNLADGYPIGVFLPLGAATLISGQDVAWTIQPYMAALGVMLALALWQLAEPLIRSRPLRALAAFTGSQAALLYGYYLWGGIKEIAAAALIASAAPLATLVVGRGGHARAVVPLALVCAALIGVLSAGGVLWLLVPLSVAVGMLVRSAGVRTALRRAAAGAALVAVLSVPVLATGGLLPPTSSPLTSADARGNLIEPLDQTRLAGVWPSGDFRVDPPDLAPTYVLVAVAIAAAGAALVLAWRRGAAAPSLYVGGSVLAGLLIFAIGSPWVDGKALATASPAVPFAAALAGALLWAGGRRVEGGVLLAAIVGGVLWSNALQYRDVNLAPRDQLAELEEIGELIDGQGPTLMTEYQPYGVRHFLRDADPEAASELRRRQVPLTEGGTLTKGEYADTDRFQIDALTVYRTLVLRRGPDQSRPPAPYGLAYRGEFYEVWQRPETPAGSITHLGLGEGVRPTGRPDCAEVRALAAGAGPNGTLVAAERTPVVVAPLEDADYPVSWAVVGEGEQVIPPGAGDLTTMVSVSRAATYEVWLRGSVRPKVELLVDGAVAGTVRHLLNNAGLSVLVGEARLTPGEHEITVRFHGADLHPGSGGAARAIGPLVLSDADAADAGVTVVAAANAEKRLCGRSWDWIEVLG
jgi:hypothetical protein